MQSQVQTLFQASEKIVIVGGGPVGSVLALALQYQNVPFTLLEARAKGASHNDTRALALSYGSRMHGRVARIVIAGFEGHSPREVGAAMLVWRGGQSGTVGGGALEFQAVLRAREMLAAGGSRWDRQALGPLPVLVLADSVLPMPMQPLELPPSPINPVYPLLHSYLRTL